jgi:hypothetical protein
MFSSRADGTVRGSQYYTSRVRNLVGLYTPVHTTEEQLPTNLWHPPDPAFELPHWGVVDGVDQFLSLLGRKIDTAPAEFIAALSNYHCQGHCEDYAHSYGWVESPECVYLGDHKRRTKFLRDEPTLDLVVCFKIWQWSPA